MDLGQTLLPSFTSVVKHYNCINGSLFKFYFSSAEFYITILSIILFNFAVLLPIVFPQRTYHELCISSFQYARKLSTELLEHPDIIRAIAQPARQAKFKRQVDQIQFY